MTFFENYGRVPKDRQEELDARVAELAAEGITVRPHWLLMEGFEDYLVEFKRQRLNTRRREDEQLADSLRAIKICNNYGMLQRFGTKLDVAVQYHPFISGRIGIGSYSHTEVWSICKNSKLLERATMGVTYQKNFRGKRERSLPEALAWVAAELECGPMVASPFRGYLPASVVKKAKDALKKQEQESPGCQTKTSSTT